MKNKNTAKTTSATRWILLSAFAAGTLLTSCAGTAYRADQRQDHRDDRQDGRQDHRESRQDARDARW